MAGILTTSPFHTKTGAFVEQATRGQLKETDWQLNMEIQDMVNGRQEAAKEFIRAVAKRLQSKKSTQHEISLTLVLLHSAAGNCSIRLHNLIAKKDFCRDALYGVISARRGRMVCGRDVEDKVLMILEEVAIPMEESMRAGERVGYTTQTAELPEIVKLVRELRARGVQFPSSRGVNPNIMSSATRVRMDAVSSNGITVHGSGPPPSSAPGYGSRPFDPHIPETTVSSPGSTRRPADGGGSSSGSAAERERLKKDLDMVKGNITLLNDLLSEYQKPNHPPPDEENRTLLSDLDRACCEMQERIARLTTEVPDSEADFLIELVTVNEQLLAVHQRHKNFQEAFDRNLQQSAHVDQSSSSFNQGSTSGFSSLNAAPMSSLNAAPMSTLSSAPAPVKQEESEASTNLIDFFDEPAAPAAQPVAHMPVTTTAGNDLLDFFGANAQAQPVQQMSQPQPQFSSLNAGIPVAGSPVTQSQPVANNNASMDLLGLDFSNLNTGSASPGTNTAFPPSNLASTPQNNHNQFPSQHSGSPAQYASLNAAPPPQPFQMAPMASAPTYNTPQMPPMHSGDLQFSNWNMPPSQSVQMPPSSAAPMEFTQTAFMQDPQFSQLGTQNFGQPGPQNYGQPGQPQNFGQPGQPQNFGHAPTTQYLQDHFSEFLSSNSMSPGGQKKDS